MLDIIIQAVSFVVIIALGYILKRIGWFKESDFSVLSTIVMKITLPAAIIMSFSGSTIDLSMLLLVVLGLGCGIIISSLTTKYRDLSILVTFGIQLWMYATPIVYPISALKEGWMKTVLLINPVTAPTELFRYAILGQGEIMPGALAFSTLLSVLILIIGVMIFNKVEKTFMDTV